MKSRPTPEPTSPEEAAEIPIEAPPSDATRVEIEAKFLIEHTAHVSELLDYLQSLDLQSVSTVEVLDRYWDTPDWHLFKAGWSYRWRDAAGEKSLILKSIGLGGGVAHKRMEFEQRVVAFPEDRDSSLPPGAVTAQLNAVGSGDMRELFRVRNCRRLLTIRTHDGALIELAIDHATIATRLSVSKSAPNGMSFVELELELKEGPEEALLQLATTLQQRFDLLASRLSKFDRGLQVARQSPPRTLGMRWPFSHTPFIQQLHTQELSPRDPAILLAYHCLLEHFQEILGHEPEAWEGLDSEGVHQMRVSVRRLQASLRAFRDVLPAASVRSFNREFQWVARTLGGVRDLDVCLDGLEDYTAQIPATDADYMRGYQCHLTTRRRSARRRLLACLLSRRYQRLKDRFVRFLERGPSRRAMDTFRVYTIDAAARQLIGKRYRRVRRAGRAVTPNSSGEALHSLRIQCRRLRYLFEFFQPIYGDLLQPEIARLKRVQDVLGDFQDARVATEQIRQYAETIPMRACSRGQLIALGQIIAGLDRRAATRRGIFPETWQRFDREGGRKAVLARLREVR